MYSSRIRTASSSPFGGGLCSWGLHHMGFDLCPGGSLYRGISVQGSLSGGFLSSGWYLSMGLCPGVSVRETPPERRPPGRNMGLETETPKRFMVPDYQTGSNIIQRLNSPCGQNDRHVKTLPWPKLCVIVCP